MDQKWFADQVRSIHAGIVPSATIVRHWAVVTQHKEFVLVQFVWAVDRMPTARIRVVNIAIEFQLADFHVDTASTKPDRNSRRLRLRRRLRTAKDPVPVYRQSRPAIGDRIATLRSYRCRSPTMAAKGADAIDSDLGP